MKVAVAMVDGAAAALALLDGLAEAPELRGYHLLPATRPRRRLAALVRG